MPVKLCMPGVAHEVTPNSRLVALLTDCRDGLKTLPDHSAHLVLTDPPYFLDGMGDDWDSQKLRERARSAGSRTSSVGSLPVGQRFDRRQGPALYEFLLPIFRECYRVLTPGGFLLSFALGRLYHRMASAADDAGFEIRDLANWGHEGGQGKAAAQTHIVEKLSITREEKDARLRKMDGRKTPQLRPMFEPFVIAQKPCEGTYEANYWRWGTGLIRTQKASGEQQTTIFSHRKPQWRFGHLTVKPVDLMADIIRVFAPPNAVILDCFMGSGSVGVAAIRLGHRFVGFERDLRHYSTAVWRLASEQLFRDYRNGLVLDSLPCIEGPSPATDRSAD